MALLDGRPDVVDVAWLAGDTLTIEVSAPEELVAGKTWLAQVRSSPTSTVVDATFDVTPPSVAGGPAYLVLPAAITRALAMGGTLLKVPASSFPATALVSVPTLAPRPGTMASGTISVRRYSGVWDCQVSLDGSDPVRTLARGGLTLDMDVSRVGP